MRNEPIGISESRILDIGNLKEYFAGHVKPLLSGKVGLEYELILIDRARSMQLSYWGGNGIAEILLAFTKIGYQAVYDGALLIGLTKESVRVSLEPGGQIEFSGTASLTAIDVHKELLAFLAALKQICAKLDVDVLAIGCNPVDKASQVEVIPSARYQAIMPILCEAAAGSSSQKITASMQVSLDYFSELHAEKCLSLGALAQPFIVAICGNSAVVGNVTTGWKSSRMRMWRDFPEARCGVPQFLLNINSDEGIFSTYTRWACNRRLFYIVRNGSVIKPGCMTFSDFMRFGYGGYEANIDDWVLHLSTLYPEARLKNVIELRSADTCSPAYAAALAAFWRGLFYSDQALERSQHLLNFIDYLSLDRLYMDAARVGLAANVAGKYKVASVAKELIETSRMGLVDLRACEAELAYLDVFLEVVNGG
ncbi:hypothetical protein J3P77_15180 [Pseudomonas sp. R1-18]|uniref:glutamate-cysteine ligase family protein n=1 Tax=Pseudomonas sp. R1-18 TaxID=1632772 RepID=UPI003DA7D62F